MNLFSHVLTSVLDNSEIGTSIKNSHSESVNSNWNAVYYDVPLCTIATSYQPQATSYQPFAIDHLPPATSPQGSAAVGVSL